MASVNTCILAGNLTRAPELRHLPKGTPVISACLAVKRRFKTGAGEQVEEVSFIEFRAFSKTAELIHQHFGKGENIMIQGRLLQERWAEKATGESRSKVVVVADSFQFLSPPKTPPEETTEAQPQPC